VAEAKLFFSFASATFYEKTVTSIKICCHFIKAPHYKKLLGYIFFQLLEPL